MMLGCLGCLGRCGGLVRCPLAPQRDALSAAQCVRERFMVHLNLWGLLCAQTHRTANFVILHFVDALVIVHER